MGKKIKPNIKSLNNKQQTKKKESPSSTIPIIEQQPPTSSVIEKSTKTKLLINLSVLHNPVGPPPKHFTIESNSSKTTANQKMDGGRARAKVDTNLKNSKTKCRNGTKKK